MVGIAGTVASETAKAAERRRNRGKRRHRGSLSAQADSPAVAQLIWFIERLNGAPVTEDDIRERFFPSDFLSLPSGAVLPPAEAILRLRPLGEQLAPVSVKTYWTPPGGGNPGTLFPIIKSRRNIYQMNFFFSPGESSRISGASVHGLTPGIREEWPTSPVLWKNWAEFDRRSAAHAPLSGVLAQELDGGRPRTIHRRLSEVQLEIGSVFKLYVLGALAQAIEEGEAAWDEPLAIRDDWRSNDGASFPTGAVGALIDYATAMIWFSNNTLTDHLLFRLGRKRVEAMFEAMGHRQPWRNRPVLSTREYFALNVALPRKRVTAYIKANEAKQRRLLDEEVLPISVAPVQFFDWVDPRNHWTIGWFASAADMCRAMVALDKMARRPGLEPIRTILGLANRFIPYQVDLSVWPYVGSKDGAVPGARSHVWWLERDDGKRFVMAHVLNDPRHAVSLFTPLVDQAGLLGLLAREPAGRKDAAVAARPERREVVRNPFGLAEPPELLLPRIPEEARDPTAPSLAPPVPSPHWGIGAAWRCRLLYAIARPTYSAGRQPRGEPRCSEKDEWRRPKLP